MANKPPIEKRFESGEIVFWCHQRGHEYSVHWGIVDEQIDFNVYIDYLEPRERKMIFSDYIKELKNGVPIDKFETEQHFHKLPKSWSYNTELFRIEYDDLSKEEKEHLIIFDIPETIKVALDKGWIVKRSEIFHGNISTEITSNGWRITKGYVQDYGIGRKPNYTTVNCRKVYRTCGEAKKEVDEHIAEFQRQAALSDYEWSVEQIEKTLDRWKAIYGVSENEVDQHRQWLLSQDDVENIEVRISNGDIQWKIWNKHKKWHNIETNI